jgi:hypothetical protein
MAQNPATQDEWTLHALNIHGVFFERACVNLINLTPDWRVISTNYPVEFPPPDGPWRGKESSLDVWARRENPAYVVDTLIECKKANPDFVNWVFFERSAASDQSHLGVVQVDNTQSAGANPTWSTSTSIARMTTSSPVVTDAREVRGDYAKHQGGNKTKTSNESIQGAAYQVALAARAIVNEENQLLNKARGSPEHPVPPWLKKFYVPVICTTAELYVVKFDSNSVSIINGEINLDQAQLSPTSSVLFEYALPKHLQLAPANPLDVLKSGNSETFSRMHIFVVQPEALVGFLSDLIPQKVEEPKIEQESA